MAVIAQHECVENGRGELALCFNPLNQEIAAAPTLLIVRAEAKAYLSLGGDESYEINGINPKIIDKLCAAKTLLIVEKNKETVVRTYDAAIGLYEDYAKKA